MGNKFNGKRNYNKKLSMFLIASSFVLSAASFAQTTTVVGEDYIIQNKPGDTGYTSRFQLTDSWIHNYVKFEKRNYTDDELKDPKMAGKGIVNKIRDDKDKLIAETRMSSRGYEGVVAEDKRYSIISEKNARTRYDKDGITSIAEKGKTINNRITTGKRDSQGREILGAGSTIREQGTEFHKDVNVGETYIRDTKNKKNELIIGNKYSNADGEKASSLGHYNGVYGENSTGVGSTNVVNGANSSALGYKNTIIGGKDSTAIGSQNKVNGEGSTALGKKNSTTGKATTAIGNENTVKGENSTAVGKGNNVDGNNSTALGIENKVKGENSNALGKGNNIEKKDSTALGNENTLKEEGTTALGKKNTLTGKNSTAVGNENTVKGENSSTLGNKNTVEGNDSTNVGTTNVLKGNNSSTLGNKNTVEGNDSTGVGSTNVVKGDNSSALGNKNTVEKKDSTALGNENSLKAEGTTALGKKNTLTGKNSTAVGQENNVTGENASTLGMKNTVDGKNSAVFGNENGVKGENSAAFGYNNKVNKNNSMGLGQNNTVNGENSSALGQSNNITGNSSSALGHNNTVLGHSSAAIGNNNNVGGNNNFAFGNDITFKNGATNSVGLGNGSTVTESNVVSVGSQGKERRITNVAEGINDTDGVNVKQLKDSINVNNQFLNAGIAQSMAMANIPQVGANKLFSIGFGAAYFNKQGGFALGISGTEKTNTFIYKIAAGIDTKKQFSVGAGFNINFGANKSVALKDLVNAPLASNSDIKAIKDALDKLQAENKELRNEVDALRNVNTKEKLYIIDQFINDKFKLTSTQMTKLQAIVNEINEKYSDRIIDITGHTDTNHNEKYNLSLGLRRANMIADLMIKLGLKNPQNIRKVSSYGFNNMVNGVLSTNRRVEITVK